MKYPIIATDAIAEYNEGIIVIERLGYPYGFALPGGLLDYGLTLEYNVLKELKEETGLDGHIINRQPVAILSDPLRDPRHHIVTVAYQIQAYGDLVAGDDAKQAYVFSIPQVKHMIQNNQFVLGHDQILNKYLERTTQ